LPCLKKERKEKPTVPQRRTAIKDLRKNRTRHMHNLDVKTDLRKSTKNYLELIKSKDKSEAQKFLKQLCKKFDKAAKRKLIHKNTAARRKSRFSLLLAQIA
jgi:small subunit ribosomal protein S20